MPTYIDLGENLGFGFVSSSANLTQLQTASTLNFSTNSSNLRSVRMASPSLDEELAAIEEALSCSQKLNLTPQHAEAKIDEEETSGSPHNNGSLSICSEKVDLKSSQGMKTTSSKAKQRNSVSINSMIPNALKGLQDLVDSDSDDEAPPVLAPHIPNPKASGGPQHRPLVGGFAAAAYEAARVDYYKKKGMAVNGHPTRPPRGYPRYP